MNIVSVERIKTTTPIQLYDIENAPNSNFVIGGKKCDYIVHNCGLLDEVSFGKGANLSLGANKMMDTYNAIKQRMKSRYMQNGRFPAMLFMVSSKKSELDFLEQYIKTVKNDKDTFIVDEPIWNVKPKETYCGARFKVAVGEKNADSLIITGGDNEIEALKKMGYNLFIDVPVEYKRDFEKDINRALMDLAGISSTGVRKFINAKNYKACITSTRKNPFTKDILTIGLHDKLNIKDFFLPELIPPKYKEKPGFIHIDASLSGDITGLGYTCILGARRKQGDEDRESEEIDSELAYALVFNIGIQAPADDVISLAKTREFIYYLRKNGFNIKLVSMDGFQSADTLQILSTKGFDTKLLSLDRTPVGYETFRAAINDERISIPDIAELEDEATNLEQDQSTRKVDHNQQHRKDMCDGAAGSVWGATLYKESYIQDFGEDLDTAVMLNIGAFSAKENLKQSIMKDIKENKPSTQEMVKNYLENHKVIDYTNLTPEQISDVSKAMQEFADTDEDVYVPNSFDDDGIIVI